MGGFSIWHWVILTIPVIIVVVVLRMARGKKK